MKLDTLPDRSAGMLTVGRSVRGCRGRSVCACMKEDDDFISLWDCGRLRQPKGEVPITRKAPMMPPLVS